MFLAEPARSPGELHFRLLGVPVRVHPWFWIVALLLGMSFKDGRLLVIWVLCMFLSILVHEFGHVLAFRRFGSRARVVLYAFGGLAIADRDNAHADWGRTWRPDGYDERNTDGWRHVMISFAGPLAGFVLAGLLVGGLFAADRTCPFVFGPWQFSLGGSRPIENERLLNTMYFLLQLNIYWGLMNLLPVYPLDGGQIARELLSMADSRRGVRRSLVLSIATGAVVAVGVLILQRGEQLLLALMFGSLAYSSFQTLKAYDASAGYGGFGGGRGDDRDW
ncbi:MAG: site-2 protease family protein [Pirellulales bacterium]